MAFVVIRKYSMLMAGGAVGTLLRYLLSAATHRYLGDGFPWGTLAVNAAGCFLAGLVVGLFERTALAEPWRFFLVVGMLGAFTTFSAFTVEAHKLIQQGSLGLFAANIAATLFTTFSALIVGIYISRWV